MSGCEPFNDIVTGLTGCLLTGGMTGGMTGARQLTWEHFSGRTTQDVAQAKWVERLAGQPGLTWELY